MKKKPPIVVIKKSRAKRPELAVPRRWVSKETNAQKEARENPLPPINYETCRIEPIDHAKAVFGSRLEDVRGSWYLDGNRILLGHLIQRANELKG